MVVRNALRIGSRIGGDGACQRIHGHGTGGSMSKHSELNSYIARLQKRLRLGAWLRGAATLAGTALIFTVALVLALNQLAFPEYGVAVARLAIFAALGSVAVFGIAVPLMSLTRARAVHRAESANLELEQRLTTFEERQSKGDDPFLELLAADTLTLTQDTEPSLLVPDNLLWALGGAGVACLAVLLWMIAAGPGLKVAVMFIDSAYGAPYVERLHVAG